MLSEQQENFLERHLLRLSDIYFGLNPIDARSLAYQYAKTLNVSYPSSWVREEMAGLEWFRGFMSRHPRLSLRKPEATSLARASAFNPTNVAAFFANYFAVMDAIKVGPSDIWNIDETGVSTVHRAVRVISRRGQRRVGHITSGERGNLVTLVQAVSATGMRAPPFFVFPRARFQPHFLNGGPMGAKGGANSSGWITAELFVEFLKIFQAFTRCNREHPVLLLLDNHESHCSLAALQFCRNNGLHVIAFPPHCSHRLQPLDVGVFKPFKIAINKQFDTFMRMNPGRLVQVFDIPSMVSRALEIGVNEVNIKSGFRSTGIWPLDADIFQEIDFMPSATTDRANPNDAPNKMDVDEEEGKDEEENQRREEEIIPSDTSTPRASTFLDSTLESLLPFPKAPPRSLKKRGRPPGQTSILTSTPEIQRITEKEKAKQQQKKEQRKKPNKKKKIANRT